MACQHIANHSRLLYLAAGSPRARRALPCARFADRCDDADACPPGIRLLAMPRLPAIPFQKCRGVFLMDFVKSRKHPVARRASAPVLTAATLATSLALALPAMAATTDAATPATDAQVATARRLPGVTVEGTVVPYKVDQVSSPKFTQPLVDTPQTIMVISNELLHEQGATTLTEALRNTAG